MTREITISGIKRRYSNFREMQKDEDVWVGETFDDWIERNKKRKKENSPT